MRRARIKRELKRVVFKTELEDIEFVKHKSGAWMGLGVTFHPLPEESIVGACLRVAHAEHFDIHPDAMCVVS